MKTNVYAMLSGYLVLLLTSAGIALGQTGDSDEINVDDALQAEYQRILSRCGLRLSDRSSLTPQEAVPIKLKDISNDQLLTFFAALDVLPTSFVHRTKLKNVVFCEKVFENGIPVVGRWNRAGPDTIYLREYNNKIVYTVLYYTIDDPMRKDTMWTRLNNPRFTYSGSRLRPENVSKSQVQRNENEGYLRDFVSRDAMVSEMTDRALTFAYMVADYKAFLKLAEENPVLAKKGEAIRKNVEKVSIDMGREFWDFLAENDAASLRQALIERAKTNAQLRKENKPPIQGGFQRTKK